MSKVRDISNLSNVIRTDASGNVSFVSGSTTLATLNTSGQLSGSSPVLSSSYASTSSYATNFNVSGTITATTLVVQTVTSSVIYSSGSNVFGNNIANTQTFTGSVNITGSVAIASAATYALDVTGTGRFTSTLLAGQGTFQSTGANIISKNTTTSQANLIRFDNSSGTARAYLGYESTNSDFYIDNGEGKILNYVSGGLSLTLNADKSATFSGDLYVNGTNKNFQVGNITIPTTSDSLRHIFAGAACFVGQDGAGEANVGNNFYYNAGFLRRNLDFATNIRFNAGNIYLQVAASGAANSAITWTNALTIANSGASTFTSTNSTLNVVAITSPPTSGYVNLQCQSNSSGNTAYGGLNVISSTGKAGYLTCGDNSFASGNYFAQASYVTLAGTAGAGLKFRVNADDTTGITIPTTGNVCLSSSDIGYKLNIYGQYGLYIGSNTNASSGTPFVVQNLAGTTLISARSDGQIGLGIYTYANAVGTPRTVYIDSAGTVGGISSILASKTNIQSFDTNWLYDLKPIQFNYRKKDENEKFTDEFNNELYYGLIAEETELVNKEICTYNEDKLIGIEYSKLIPVLLKAIQEQQAQINELKAQING